MTSPDLVHCSICKEEVHVDMVDTPDGYVFVAMCDKCDWVDPAKTDPDKPAGTFRKWWGDQ